MWEMFKIMWDVFVLRDAARRGKLNWRKTGLMVGFAVLEYLIAMPALLLYIQHPQSKPLFIAAMVLATVILVLFLWLMSRWRSRPVSRLANGRVAGLPRHAKTPIPVFLEQVLRSSFAGTGKSPASYRSWPAPRPR